MFACKEQTLHITVTTEIDDVVWQATEAVTQARREGGNQSHMVFLYISSY